jgi:photosystem II stability/assembly factor-like uncharacterized protein
MSLRPLLLVACFAALPAYAAGFTDVLSRPAVMSPLASKGLLQGVARAGGRLVAVGQRGHIVVSSDDGKTWRQSPVPVSSDLTAVHFVNDRKGWAVGHDGVILATGDAGATWTLQLDGIRANQAVLADIERKAAAHPGSEESKTLLVEARRNVEFGADKPFLDVWFADEKSGYAVGAYNLIFRTADGGATWEPWFDRTDNPKFLNLYAIRPAAGGLFIAGEAGLLLKLDPGAQRFRAVELPYQGTILGIAGDNAVVLVFGLRGNAYRSDDAGRNWVKVDASLPATIVAGASLRDNRFALADASGRVSLSTDGARSFKPLPITPTMMLAGLTDVGDGRLALVGARGVSLTAVPAR